MRKIVQRISFMGKDTFMYALVINCWALVSIFFFRDFFHLQRSFLPRFAFLVLIVGSVSGCTSVWKESFDCPVGEGVRCASMSSIQKKMDRGQFSKEEEGEEISQVYFGEDFVSEGRDR